MEYHPIANIFPMMQKSELRKLADDIKATGLQNKIILYEDKILDGRNRFEACELVGIESHYSEYEGDEPMAYVISQNLHRRHLNESQRAAVASKLTSMTVGGDRKSDHYANLQNDISQPEAAKMLNVSTRMVASVKAIEKINPGKIKEIEAGEKTVNQAQREIKEEKKEERREQNAELVKDKDVFKTIQELDANFATIVIDPPWDWKDEKDQDQLGRARPAYKTLSFEQLLNLPINTISDIDCHLYLWITNRSLPKGFSLIEKWGFRYITCLTWCKPSFGMGNYFRGSTEHVLFGVKGSQQLKRKDVGTWFSANRGGDGHSSKPDELYDLVESCSPGPFVDIFSRKNREGWIHVGAEI